MEKALIILGVLLMFGFGEAWGQKKFQIGFRAGTSFYQPRIRFQQNAPKPGIDIRGFVLKETPNKLGVMIEAGYILTRIPDIRTFYSTRTGQLIDQAPCTNLNHYLTFSSNVRFSLLKIEWFKGVIGAELNYLIRNQAFCRYNVNGFNLSEWQGPFSLKNRDRFYPLLTTGIEAIGVETPAWKLALFLNIYHQLPAFRLAPSTTSINPLTSSRYFAPAMSWNAGIRWTFY